MPIPCLGFKLIGFSKSTMVLQAWSSELTCLWVHFDRQLHAYLRALLNQDGDSRGDAGKKDEVDNIPAILAIFAEIKRAEDAVDSTKTEVKTVFSRLL